MQKTGHIPWRFLLAGVGLSFVWPYFYWTFFLVSTFGDKGLYAFDGPTALFLALVAAFSAASLLMRGSLAACLEKAQAPALLAACLCAAAPVVLYVCRVSGLDMPVAARAACIVLAAGSLPLLLTMWIQGMRLLAASDARSVALVVLSSMVLFFVYALLFIVVVAPRCVLALGAAASAAAWYLLNRRSGSAPAALSQDGFSSASASAGLRGAWLAYALTSVVYWMLFAIEASGAAAAESFSVLGISPLSQGHPAFYALLLLFFLALAFAVLASDDSSARRMAATVEAVLVLCAIAFFASAAAFAEAYFDLVEGACCLVRACLQFFLLLACMLRARKGVRAGALVFVIPVIDAVSMALPSQLMAAGVVDGAALLGMVAPVSFALMAACLVWAGVAMTRKAPDAADAHADAEGDLRTACRKAAANCGLSTREEEVLYYAAQGYSARRIAEVLVISASTVQTHVSRIYTKLGVRTKQELIDYMKG